ncbi:MAG TPA: YfhO family protein, partial [Thermoanaerobaculia bacterium]
PPWYFVVPDHAVRNTDMNDIPLQQLGWIHAVRESWKSLTVPLWNSFNGAGYPLMANGQSSAFSPFRLVTLPLPLGKALTVEASLKIFIALLFTFLFCRERGRSRFASLVAAIAFGFGGFVTIWIHFPIVTTACFLPAVMYLIERMAGRPSPGTFAAMALVWAAIVFGGHPETAAHIGLMTLAYAAWVALVARDEGGTIAPRRLLLRYVGAVAIGALLALPFILPFAEAMTKSHRFAQLRNAPWSAAALPFANRESLFAAIQPHLYGRVPEEKTWGASLPDPMSAFAGTLAIAAWFATIVAIARRRAWRSRETFFAVSALLALGTFMSWPGLGTAVHVLLPIVAHARTRLLFGFLLAVMSAEAIDRVRRGERMPMLVGIAAAASSIACAFRAVDFPSEAWRHSAVIASIPSLAVLGVALVFVLTRRNVALAVLGAAVALELFSLFRGWSPPVPSTELAPATPMIRTLQAIAAETPPTQPFRIAGMGAMLFPNTNALFGLEDVRAHDPMVNERYVQFLAKTAGYNPQDYIAMLHDADAPVLDFLNVRFVLDDPGREKDPSRYRLVYDGPDGRIFENLRVLPRFFAVRSVLLEYDDARFDEKLSAHRDWANTALVEFGDVETPQMRDDVFGSQPADARVAAAHILAASPTDYRLRVDAPRWSLIASSIPWWRGWTVTRNGKRVEPIRVNGAFLGFAVPPGTTDVRVRYEPWTFRAGAGIALVTLVGLIAGLARARRGSGTTSSRA